MCLPRVVRGSVALDEFLRCVMSLRDFLRFFCQFSRGTWAGSRVARRIQARLFGFEIFSAAFHLHGQANIHINDLLCLT